MVLSFPTPNSVLASHVDLLADRKWNLRSEIKTVTNFDRITTAPARMNGKPCIRTMRLTVRRVLEALATYPDRAELEREYPEFDEEDIRQALAFAAACFDDKILPPVVAP